MVGLMPHPERASSDLLGSTDGLVLFSALLRAGSGTRKEATSGPEAAWPAATQAPKVPAGGCELGRANRWSAGVPSPKTSVPGLSVTTERSRSGLRGSEPWINGDLAGLPAPVRSPGSRLL